MVRVQDIKFEGADGGVRLDFKKDRAALRPGRCVRTLAEFAQTALHENGGEKTVQVVIDQRTRSVSWKGPRIAFLADGRVVWTGAGEALLTDVQRTFIDAIVAGTP